MRVRWWRLLAVPAAGLLLVAGCWGGAGRDAAPTAVTPTLPVAATPQPSGSGPLLGAIWSEPPATLRLARLDPVQLQPLPGPRLKLNGNWSVQTVAPDRSIAVLSNDDGDLAVVDLVRMRNLGRMRLPTIGLRVGWVAASTFVGRSRLLLAGAAGDDTVSTVAVTLVDLATRRVLRQQHLNGQVLASARLPGGLALLLAPSATIGAARLALVRSDTRVRMVTLDRIAAGFQRLRSDESDPRSRQAVPGLAVDAAGRHAFVVAAAAAAAEVDLVSLGVVYHRLGRPASPLRRLASWLLAPAEAKETSGPVRSVLWLGDGLLAVVGVDASAGGGFTELPSGLELVDTRTWTARRIEQHASSAIWVGGRLLVWGVSFGPDRNQGYGLMVFGPGQRRPVHLLGSQQVVWVQASGELAYASLSEGDQTAYAVIDLRSNRVLRHAQGDLPQLILPGMP